MEQDANVGSNFIKGIINSDLAAGKHKSIVTRFPPEPNGYLHIGHAKSICLNFSLAQEYPDSRCHLRFDDTNPEKEETEYIEAIKADVKWLGFDWNDHLYHASDYFDQLYDFATALIKRGKAYVCELTGEDIRNYRGTLTEPGKNSPFRDRSVEENLELFARMKQGHFADGQVSLRAKIDMSSGNINMRDPILYRCRKVNHHRTGDKWCIYPMYDFTHCISDSIEGITHSICTLEFEDHRPLYDWILETLECPSHPQQIEFARLAINYTVTSKRKLKELIDEKIVTGWDDPRLPTIGGLKQRGFTPASIRNFCKRIGVSKKNSVIDMAVLEECARDDLNATSKRAMCVLNPLKVVITNYPEETTEELVAPNHPQDPSFGERKMSFSREIWIEQDDFMEAPPKQFHRLAPGKEVRLRYGYVIRCDEVVKDSNGKIKELLCSYDKDTLGKKPEGRKVKGIIHWVDKRHGVDVEVRLYDRLFKVANPEQGGVDYKENINPDSLIINPHAIAESSVTSCEPGQRFQFERVGYFFYTSCGEKLLFNRITTLKDTWAKISQKSE